MIFNAKRHTPDGTKIIASWSQEPEGGACFEVQDYGSGIPSRHLTRLTERIDKGRSKGQKKVALALGWRLFNTSSKGTDVVLDIKSELSKGSVFSVCFAKSSVIF